MNETKKRKNLHLSQDNVQIIEEISKKSSVGQSSIVDKILTEFFNKNKKKIGVGITL